MGWGTLPEPGKMVDDMEIGPCVDEDCGHKDCEATREMANKECLICGEEIGYERRFYNKVVMKDGEEVKGLVHANCVEE